MLVFTRNAAGELVSEENHGGKFEYEYDALGNLSSTTFPDGRELATLRYGTGHLLEMQLRHGGATHTLAAYGRDRLHREISRSQGVLSQETRYDAAGRVTQRTVLDARRELVFERRYRWDRTDQIVQQIHTDSTPATPGEKYSQYLWGYDAAGQVTKAVEPQKEERFFRDPAGNRTEEHRNPVWHNLLLRLDKFKRMNVTSDEYMRWRTPIGNVKFLGDDGIMGIHTLPYSGCVTLQLSLAHKGMIAFAEKAKDIESYLNALRKWSSKRLPFGLFNLPF